ncbi:MAG: hypothetical protein KTR31_20720 [Myxococcales bacterium]|nr:hypothetical protein [Myxococcales bacterium]
MSRTVCLDCDESLDSWTYSLACLVALAGGMALEGSFAAMGLRPWEGWFSFIADAFASCVPLLIFGYPVFKLYQKWKTPARPTLRELGSAFSDRLSRVLVLLLAAFVASLAIGGLRLPLTPPDPSFIGWYDLVQAWFLLLAFTGLLAAFLLDQGLAFFDLRIRNTYAKRERGEHEPSMGEP